MEKTRINDISHDKRIIERKIRQGEMNAEELQKYLQDLPDVSLNAEEVSVSMERKKEKKVEQGDAH